MKERFKIACHPATMRHALKYALIVGPILVIINYADSILRHEVDITSLIKLALTLLVPYLVATFSSVGTIFKMRRGFLDDVHKNPDSD